LGLEEILTGKALKEGFFAALFVGLLVWQMKEYRRLFNRADEREDKLISFLDKMKEEFAGLTRQYERLSDDVAELKNRIDRK
jgi:predicted  nucleic acid-binding Zn-ribbon protein